MNKKLLASAIIAAVAASPAAFAESTVYGKMHTSIDNSDFDNGRDNTTVENRSSRLGFKGSEDLGNGLKAIYQIEFGIRSDGGDQQTGDDDGMTTLRNTFVGLSGDWGTVVVGRHDTPMKMAFYAAGVENLGDSAIDLNPSSAGLNPIGVFQEFRANNAVAYISPNFSGFTVAAAFIPGEQDGSKDLASSVTTVKDLGDVASPGGTAISIGGVTGPVTRKNDLDGVADHYSLGAMYKGNGLQVGIGYEMQADQPVANWRTPAGIVASDDEKTMQVGASYTMNNFKVGAQYQDTDNNGNVKDADYTAWAVTGRATFGNNAISLAYTDSSLDPNGSSADVDTDGWGVGAEHNFSKRTKVYAAYAANSVDNKKTGSDKDPDQDMFSLGMIHNF